ncbi:hypothetical protein, partial [Streptomyces sp. SID337]|uniref:hypothetical protein n=1 Tax=Streptomyces sp. SID337 TaxID=2690262 RepID=UPI001F3D1E2E
QFFSSSVLQFFAARCTVKGTDHPDGLFGPCMQVTTGYERTELVHGPESLAPDPEGSGSRCCMRRAVPLLVLPVPPVVLAPYELVRRANLRTQWSTHRGRHAMFGGPGRERFTFPKRAWAKGVGCGL